jgi:hypothetical protein
MIFFLLFSAAVYYIKIFPRFLFCEIEVMESEFLMHFVSYIDDCYNTTALIRMRFIKKVKIVKH